MQRSVVLVLAALTAVVYYLSNPAPARVFDQTFTIADAMLAKLGLLRAYPAGLVTACQAALLVLLANGLASAYAASRRRRILLILFLLYGNWTWCDLSFGGAWHHALGFSMIGQLAALFFILVRRSAALAGLSFALAFGNRTELLLVGPVLAYLLLLPEAGAGGFLAPREGPVPLLRCTGPAAAVDVCLQLRALPVDPGLRLHTDSLRPGRNSSPTGSCR